MKRLSIVFAALLLPQAPATIDGTVVYVSTGRPVESANVELTRIEGGRVVSQQTPVRNGRFSFRNLPAGIGYQLVVRGTGLRPTAYGQKALSDPWKSLTLEPGQHLADLVITAQSVSRLTGRILDAGGKGLAGARVSLMTPVYVGGRRELQRTAATQANSRGEYVFGDLDAGSYYLRVSPQNDSDVDALFNNPAYFDQTSLNSRSPVSREPEGYPLVYYPGTSIESAKVLVLEEGQRLDNVNVTVAKTRTGRLRGKITFGAVARGVSVFRVSLFPVESSPDSNWSRFYDSSDGTFDFRGVQPGKYLLNATTTGQNPPLAGRTTVEVKAGETSALDLSVASGTDIAGRMTVDGERAEAGNLSSLAVSLVAQWSGPVDRVLPASKVGTPSVGARVAADGTFTLLSVPPWDYRVHVSPVPRAYVKSVRLGARDVLQQGLAVPDAGQGMLEIVLGTDIGRLDGRVRDDKGRDFGAARVVLVPEARHRRERYIVTSSSTTGRFQMDVPPGRYKAFAWDSPPEGAWTDPDFLGRYENLGVAVEIAPEGSEFVDLKVIP